MVRESYSSKAIAKGVLHVCGEGAFKVKALKRLLVFGMFAALQSSAWAQGAGDLDFKGAFIESLFVTICFAVLGGILFWLIAGRYWGKVKTKPYQLGLWWGAWLVAASVMAVGGNNYSKGLGQLVVSMILVVPTYFLIGFIVGFVFRKLKPIA